MKVILCDTGKLYKIRPLVSTSEGLLERSHTCVSILSWVLCTRAELCDRSGHCVAHKAENIACLAFYRKCLPSLLKIIIVLPKTRTEQFWNRNLKILSFHLKRSVTSSFTTRNDCSLWKY